MLERKSLTGFVRFNLGEGVEKEDPTLLPRLLLSLYKLVRLSVTKGSVLHVTKGSTAASTSIYKRVMLKISGESLMGRLPYGIDPEMVGTVALQVKDVVAAGIEVCLVIGGGNIFRGMSGAAAGMERVTGDYMGMLATVMNALAMQNALEQLNVPVRVLSPKY